MIKKLARWILRNEITPRILPPSRIMMSLKHIFYQENKDAGMAYAMAIKIAEMYKVDYERCTWTCKEIIADLNELKEEKSHE